MYKRIVEMADYQIRVFGIFRDIVNEDKILVDVDQSLTLGKLKMILEQRFPDFKKINYMTAVNQEYCREDDKILSEVDEIAFLPPVAGG